MIRFRKGYHSYALGIGRLTFWLRHSEAHLPRFRFFVRPCGEPFA